MERRPHPSFPWCFADTDGHIYRGAELIKGHKSKAGYRVHAFRNDKGLYKHVLAHRLVYECFNGEILGKLQVHHVNGVTDDNRLTNLQCVTRREHNGLTFKGKSQRQLESATGRPVIAISDENEQEFPSIREASRRLGISSSAIAAAIKRAGKCKGLQWKFKTVELQRETWKDVTPYGHAVSDMGRVKFPNGRVTFGRRNVYGYYVVDIQGRRQQVHRLVAQRFLEAVDVPTIAHKDADRGNNRVNNLEYATYKQQNMCPIRIMRFKLSKCK